MIKSEESRMIMKRVDFTKISAIALLISSIVAVHSEGQNLTDAEAREAKVPLMRMELFMMTADMFPQYLRGGDRYESIIDDLFLLGYGPYETGEGTIFEMSFPTGETAVWRREVVTKTEAGQRWWRTEYEGPRASVAYDVLVNRSGVPFIVRVTNPETGEVEERNTRIGESFREAAEQLDPETLQSANAQRRQEKIDELMHLSRGASVEGRDEITTPAGTFSAIHLTRSGGNATLHYWVALDVPGNLIRIATSSDPTDDEIVGELIEIYEVR